MYSNVNCIFFLFVLDDSEICIVAMPVGGGWEGKQILPLPFARD